MEEAVETVEVQIDGEIEEVLPMCVKEDPALDQGQVSPEETVASSEEHLAEFAQEAILDPPTQEVIVEVEATQSSVNGSEGGHDPPALALEVEAGQLPVAGWERGPA